MDALYTDALTCAAQCMLYICVLLWIAMYTYTHAHTHTYMHTHAHTRAHAHTTQHTHTHTTHTYMHTHLHTRVCLCSAVLSYSVFKYQWGQCASWGHSAWGLVAERCVVLHE